MSDAQDPPPAGSPDAADGSGVQPPTTLSSEEVAALPEVVVHKRRAPSTIWIVPIVAALVGGWLWYDAVQSQGPLITIVFEDAEGLQAGKTTIRRLAVEVGTLETITLSDDGSKVVATARMSPDVETYLREETVFWAVRPRIGAGGVEGLSTILSGVFIGMQPGGGAPARDFVAAADPPVTGLDGEHLKLVLTSDDVGSLGPGSPIQYHGKDIGAVEDTVFVDDGHHVEIHVRIERRFRHLVSSDSHFWNMSGLRMSYGAGGVEVELASVATLLIGGVSMDTPEHGGDGEPVRSGARFPLHQRRGQWNEPDAEAGLDYVLYFEDSVRGLLPGAPVEYRGYQVGHVTGVEMVKDELTEELLVAVTMRIEPQRIRLPGRDPADEDRARAECDRLVAQGLRARLETGSYLSGALFVALDMHADPPPFERREPNVGLPALPEFPTVRGGLALLLERIDGLPFEELGIMLETLSLEVTETFTSGEYDHLIARLDDSLTHVAELTGAARDQFGAELELFNRTLGEAQTAFQDIGSTLDELDATLTSVDAAVERIGAVADPEGSLMYGLRDTLDEFGAAARSLRSLMETLERHPESLIRGKPDGGQ